MRPTPARVLIVEDEAILALDLERRVRAIGHSVVGSADSAALAIQCAREQRPDLVLMDIRLKGERDGVSAADEIRRDLDVPTVFLTAFSDRLTLGRAVTAEPFGYVVKPVDDRSLEIAVDVALYRHDAERRIRRMEQWLSATLTSIGDGVIATDLDGRVTFMNAVAKQLTGWELPGAQRLDDVLNLVDDETGRRLESPIRQVLLEGVTVDVSPTTTLIRRSGEHLPVSRTAAPIRDKDETITGVVIIVRDVAEQRRASETLRQSQKIAAVGRLAGGIAHEFNNLMTVVGGVSELLLTDTPVAERTRANIEAIRAAADRAATLTRQLLTFSGRHPVRPEVFDLNATLRAIEPLLMRVAGTHVQMTLPQTDQPALIEADQADIERAVINLVANARDAMPAGGRVTITTRVSATEVALGRTVELEVADTGTGMTSEALEHLFEPFFTTKDVGKGTGLGLASVHGTVAQAGGRIEVESTAGAGSRFTLVFPEPGSPPVEPHTDRAGRRDLDDRKRSEQTLRRLVDFEAFLFDLSSTFIGLPEEQVDAHMVLGLARVGEFLAMDRVTLLELSRAGDEMVVAYSWSARGVPDASPRIPRNAQPWWFGRILRGTVSLATHVDDLPEDAALEKEYLRQRGIASAASIPLRVGGDIAGAISFVTVHRHESWTEERVKQLKAVGDILWNALKRRQAMQTLRATQDLVRQSEERFRLAMNNVAAGLYTLDLEGRVTYVNPAAEAMFGWTMGEMLGKKMHDVAHYKHPDGTPFPASHCQCLQVLQIGNELRERSDVFVRKNGQFFPVVYSASPLKKEDGTTVGVVIGCRDDTLRREAERAIRDSEERFRLIANTAPVIIWMSDADQHWTFVNESWGRLTGQVREAAMGHRWMDLLHPDDVAQVRATYAAACDQHQPFQMEYRLRRHDGAYRWVFVHGVPRYDASRSFAGYAGSAIDVTERKEAEDALSTFSQRLIEAQEVERARLARELHDDINQRLTLLVLNLEAVKQRFEVSVPALASEIGEAVDAALTLTGDVQSLSHRLHSSQLRHLGLEAAARSMCSELSERTTVEIQFHSEPSVPDLPEDVSLNLYRVLQEGVQNAVKHSQSPRVEVLLRADTSHIELIVRDSGVGFEPNAVSRGRGLGLVGMKERLKLIGGELTIEARPAAGTTIRARVPLNPKGEVARNLV